MDETRSRLLSVVVRCAIAAMLIPRTSGFAQQGMTSDIWTNLDEVRAYLEHAAGETDFSGVVLIARGNDVVFEEAYGLAEVEHRVPMRTDHRFRLGSLTKPVTASAVLAAVDRGQLRLDARPCRWLSSCPLAWHEVTVRHLLTHSSGIADHFGDLASVPVTETLTELNRVLDSLPPDEPLLAAPGAEYAYSNFNYVLLAAMLERVTERDWESILREWVFEPLGLSTMAYDDVYAIMEHRVRGYERHDSLGLRNIDYDDHAAYAAGGLVSTARDVFRWARGMLTGQLFSVELVRESLEPYAENYGYGWVIRQFFDRTVYNHTGGIDGFSSHLAHYPGDDLTLVVLSNVQNDSAILRGCDVTGRLFGWPNATVPPDTALTPRQRCGLEG